MFKLDNPLLLAATAASNSAAQPPSARRRKPRGSTPSLPRVHHRGCTLPGQPWYCLRYLPEVSSGPWHDLDSPKAFIRLTGAELDEEETMGCRFTQFRALAALRRSSACDRGQAIARRHRLRGTGPE
jgi:hypothetical protein